METVRVEQSRSRAAARQDREHGSQVARAAERKGKYWYARWVLSGRPSQERRSGRGRRSRKTSGEERGRRVLHRAGPRCIPPFTAIRTNGAVNGPWPTERAARAREDVDVG